MERWRLCEAKAYVVAVAANPLAKFAVMPRQWRLTTGQGGAREPRALRAYNAPDARTLQTSGIRVKFGT